MQQHSNLNSEVEDQETPYGLIKDPTSFEGLGILQSFGRCQSDIKWTCSYIYAQTTADVAKVDPTPNDFADSDTMENRPK